jgi:hypothetical protein
MSLVYLKLSNGDKYFFDAVFKEQHTLTNVITQNPVQTGTAVTDHVYQQPITVSFDIGMSDVMKDIIPGQYSAGDSRSANAYKIFMYMWQNALLMDVSTSFIVYQNMVIQSIQAYRDNTTMKAMKATIVLQELITVNAISQSISADNQVTDTTPKGKVNPTSKKLSTNQPNSATASNTGMVSNTGAVKVLTDFISTVKNIFNWSGF